ncbi:MAG: alanine racemase [Solirubrobacterales bacterium]
MAQRALASVNTAAIERNTALMAQAAGEATLCAVVKANGYGHGMLEAAHAALAGGARWLAVATADEAVALRGAGFEVPVLVMGALTAEEAARAVQARADLVAWTAEFLDLVDSLGGAPVHVKLDSGMGRFGTRSAEEATALAERLASSETSRLAGLMTHFATADQAGDEFFGEQLACFRAWALPLAERFPGATVHAANSAAVLRDPEAAFDMVRPGVALYGMDPFGEDAAARGLEPALELRSWAAAVKGCEPGQSVGYGRAFIAGEPTVIATVPIGYGDGWRRSLGNRGEVLIAGQRRPVVGMVSMDNLAVDLGPGTGVEVGEPVFLLGGGAGAITAEEVARELGTINYEVTSALTSRVTRAYHRDGEQETA